MLQVDPRRRPLQLLGVAVLGTALLSACGSNGKTASSSTPLASGSGGASSAASSSEVDTASKAIEAYLQVPTKINQSEPLTKKLPTDKTWVLITCELPQCK